MFARESALASLAALLVLAQTAQAHFLLNYPEPLGKFIDDDEDKAPCGGYTPDFATQKVTPFHVGGESISLLSTHPQTNYLFRVTTDQTAAGNWSQIYPIVQQSGLKNFCLPSVAVDPSWVGKTVVLSVVANGPDGMLYQCAAVNFIAGTGSPASGCTNTTGVTGSITTDSTLSALVSSSGSGSGSSSSSSSSSTTASGTSSTTATSSAATASSTAKASAAGALRAVDGMTGLVGLLALGAMAMAAL